MPSLDAIPQVENLLPPGRAGLGRLSSLGLAVAGVYGIYMVITAVYRLWFHPLAKFQGPWYLAVSDLPFLYLNYLRGTFMHRAPALHRKYGKFVRIGPDRLLVDGAVAWSEVFAHRPGGDANEFHKVPGYFAPNDHLGIIGSPNREIHRRRRRRALAHGFSETAMYEQEPIITFYVDLFIQRLSERAAEGKPIDMLSWLNFLTFDIIGDLTWGESFHSLEKNDYHFWIRNLFRGLRGSGFIRFLSYSGLGLLSALDLSGDIKQFHRNRQYTFEKVAARFALGAEPSLPSTTGDVGVDGKPKMTVRRDFMTYMMRKNKEGEKQYDYDEMRVTANTLIVAGSETTATNLTTLFFLLGQPRYKAYREAAIAEVRSLFSRETDITLRSVQADALPFVHACIEEALRYQPPVNDQPPRVSPGATVAGEFVPKGTMITVAQKATYHNPDNFLEPDSFRPERFLPRGHPKYDPRFAAHDNMAAFKPFSNGPRDCIGKNLAFAEMRLITARFLLRFDFELAEGMPLDYLDNQRVFIIWEKGPMWLKLTERKDLEVKGTAITTN